jgi:hypothetical protein
MLNSLIYSNRATPYRAKSGLVLRPKGEVQQIDLNFRDVLKAVVTQTYFDW